MNQSVLCKKAAQIQNIKQYNSLKLYSIETTVLLQSNNDGYCD